jgi:hypothetical protein
MISSIIVLIVLAFVAWPYVQLNRLGRAIDENDEHELRRLVDVEAIRRRFKGIIDQNIEGVTERYDNPIIRFVRGGVKELSGSSLESVDVAWVRNTLFAARHYPGNQGPQLLGGFSFGFFEAPSRFLIRAGKLGQEPIHLYMSLKDWKWRVTAVFV